MCSPVSLLFSAIRASVVWPLVDPVEPAELEPLVGATPGVGCQGSVALLEALAPYPSLARCASAFLLARALMPSAVITELPLPSALASPTSLSTASFRGIPMCADGKQSGLFAARVQGNTGEGFQYPANEQRWRKQTGGERHAKEKT